MRIRFAIRDLLWLALVVGLSVGWWFERSAMRRTQEHLTGQQKLLTDDLAQARKRIEQLEFFKLMVREREQSEADYRIKSMMRMHAIPDRSSAEETPSRAPPEPQARSSD